MTVAAVEPSLGHETARPRLRSVTPVRVAWALVGGAVVLIAFFDAIGPALAFNDDWGFAWSVAHFPRIYPADSALAFPQDAWARLITFGDADRRLLRLTIIPFVVGAVAAVHALARRAGADRTWSSMAALSLVACPVFAADATTFMTDVPYVALELAFLLAAARWLETRRAPALVVLAAAAAASQRQIGVLLAVALVGALVVRPKTARMDFAVAGAALLAGAGAVAAFTVTGVAPPTEANRLAAASSQSMVFGVLGFMFLPGVVGLGIAGLAPGLLRGPWFAWPLAAAVIAWETFVFTVAAHDVLPGNVFVPAGINITLPPHEKPVLYPAGLFLTIETVAVASAAGLAMKARTAVPRLSPLSALLLAAAVVQFMPLLLVHYIPFDRYFLPIIGALLPLAARAASGSSAVRAWAGIGIAAAMLAIYAIGEQDYQAWQTARDIQARNAYRIVSPYEVDAGYEANAVYGEVPAYDSSGRILSGLADPTAPDFSESGPAHPVLLVRLVPASDPRPGVGYWSLAPGKVIIVRVSSDAS